MNLLFKLLTEVEPAPLESPVWAWVLLVVLLTTPWLGLIYYLITLKYRVRVFVNGHLFSTTYLKAGQSISNSVIIPYKEYHDVVLYLDEELTTPLLDDSMPKQNLKLYVNYVER